MSTHVLISGANSGLGRACVLEAESRGYLAHGLDIGFDRDTDNTYLCDIRDEDRMAEVLGQLPPLDLVVHCAGIAPAAKLYSASRGGHITQLFDDVIDVNTRGSFLMLKHASAQMIAHGKKGLIILTSSIAAYEGQLGQVAYAASKGAVASMILPAARELSSYGIRVMGIAPGVFDTAMVAKFSEDIRKDLAAQIPYPSRLGDPKEFAQLAFHIFDNTYLNGGVIRLDGAVRMT